MNAKTNGELVAADAAHRLGLQLTAVGLANLAAQIDVLGVMKPGEPVTVTNVPVVEWMAAQITASPSWTAKSANAEPDLTLNRTERAKATVAAQRNDEAKAAKAKALHEAHGNPWQSSRLNRSHQGLIANLDPALAETLRAEASL